MDTEADIHEFKNGGARSNPAQVGGQSDVVMPAMKWSYIFAFAATAENQDNIACVCIKVLVQKSVTNV